jgi:KUP system potassium uptake protein
MAQSVVPSQGAEAPIPAEQQAQATSRFVTLTLGSVGVVYGDIGTSPLYAFREAVLAAGGGGASRAAVLGVLSLILWALILIVTCKYVIVL